MSPEVTLPDFSDLQECIDKIAKLQYGKSILDIAIKKKEAMILKEVTTNKDYFMNGKPAAFNYIEKTYIYTGISEDLIELRMKLAQLTADYEKEKLRYDMMGKKIEVWRSQRANERASIL